MLGIPNRALMVPVSLNIQDQYIENISNKSLNIYQNIDRNVWKVAVDYLK